MKTIQQLSRQALEVQDACNLSGVVHVFSQVITDLREIAQAEGWEGTDAINQHPICIMYIDKMASLSGSTSAKKFSSAYAWVADKAS